MCGIAGVVGETEPGPRRRSLGMMLTALGHRGPDGSGSYGADGIGLVHTRLAIIDPTQASDQPMVDEGSGCVLVYNGEIYNYRELRHQLEALGHRFRSNGDTEVLLRSYLQWGDDCLDRLNGMFAFAVWDPRAQALLLARDRLGEKPLHLCRHGSALWFASELKALVAAGISGTSPCWPYLFRFLALGDLGHPTETPLSGVTQLAPAHACRVNRSGAVTTWRYWSPEPATSRPISVDEVADRFAALFDDAVRLRLRSDVPLGTSLSGGLDSSLVLATARAHRPSGDLHAFTASFPGTVADELAGAEAVAARLDATVHPVPLSGADLADQLDAMIRANEGPVESPSTFAQFAVMHEARRAGITVLLDGQGADETWAGYEKYALAAAADRLISVRPLGALKVLLDWRTVRGGLPHAGLLSTAGLLAGPRARKAAGNLILGRLAPWLSPAFRREHDRIDVLGMDEATPKPRPLPAALSRADLQRITLPRLLRYADRNSMAWSREVRLPFLDHRLVEFAAATHHDHKLVEGWSKEPVRRALEGRGLGDVARRRDKRAYMPPNDQWMAHPALVERVTHAWAQLHRAGLTTTAEPVAAVLPRWRVLTVDAWADSVGIALT